MLDDVGEVGEGRMAEQFVRLRRAAVDGTLDLLPLEDPPSHLERTALLEPLVATHAQQRPMHDSPEAHEELHDHPVRLVADLLALVHA